MSDAKPKAEVDKRACIAAGMCLEVAPGSFRLGEDGLAEFVPSADVDYDDLVDAQQSCPSGAITVTGERNR